MATQPQVIVTVRMRPLLMDPEASSPNDKDKLPGPPAKP